MSVCWDLFPKKNLGVNSMFAPVQNIKWKEMCGRFRTECLDGHQTVCSLRYGCVGRRLATLNCMWSYVRSDLGYILLCFVRKRMLTLGLRLMFGVLKI
jgi:hypothetical protein